MNTAALITTIITTRIIPKAIPSPLNPEFLKQTKHSRLLMKTALLIATVFASSLVVSNAAYPFSNARWNNNLAAALEHRYYGLRPSVVEVPTQHFYKDGTHIDYDWCGVPAYAVRSYVVEHGFHNDYVWSRPVDRPLYEPSSVYSNVWGAVVPYPVDYSGLPAVPEKPHEGYSHIEPVVPFSAD